MSCPNPRSNPRPNVSAMSKFDLAVYHRKSIRLRGYDYTQAGAYFVTMVTHHRDCLFGEIKDGEMTLSDLGVIADECWRAIPAHFPFVDLGAHVVMPNHVHGIIVIDRRGTPWRAPTAPQFGKSIAGSIATMIGQYKSSVSRIIKRQFHATAIWQRNYYEHIIRTDREMNGIWRYIEANPAHWEDDEENRPAARR